ncbi:MAG: hypothetical protein Q4A67_02110 [Aerococcus sp.]|nr:hypothetical protein [Aerococcus sp.]
MNHLFKQKFKKQENNAVLKKEWYKKWQTWVIVGFIVLCLVAIFYPVGGFQNSEQSERDRQSALNGEHSSNMTPIDSNDPDINDLFTTDLHSGISSLSDKDLKNIVEDAEPVSYYDLRNHSEAHDLKYVKLSGKIVNVNWSPSIPVYQLKVDNKFNQTALLFDVEPYNSDTIMENDFVDITAISLGNRTSTSALGLNVKLPVLAIDSIKRHN